MVTLTVTLTLVLKKKAQKPTIFEVLQGVLNDTGEVQKKIFFWRLLGSAPVRHSKNFRDRRIFRRLDLIWKFRYRATVPIKTYYGVRCRRTP